MGEKLKGGVFPHIHQFAKTAAPTETCYALIYSHPQEFESLTWCQQYQIVQTVFSMESVECFNDLAPPSCTMVQESTKHYAVELCWRTYFCGAPNFRRMFEILLDEGKITSDQCSREKNHDIKQMCTGFDCGNQCKWHAKRSRTLWDFPPGFELSTLLVSDLCSSLQ